MKRVDNKIVIVSFTVVAMTMAIISFQGCGRTRDLSSPEKAILGHWIAENGDADYYFSANTYIMVDHGREDSGPFEIPYKVLASDTERNWLRIGLVEEEDSEFWKKGEISVYREFVISESGTSLNMGFAFDRPETGTAYEESIDLTQETWLYVDEELEP